MWFIMKWAFLGICVCFVGRIGKRSGTVKNLPEGLTNGEYNPEENELKLFSNGKIRIFYFVIASKWHVN